MPRRLALAACGVLLSAAPGITADDAPAGQILERIQEQVHAIYDRSGPAVVRIAATSAHERLVGTGFFIDPNGTLYTSYSIGGESQDIVVYFRGKTHPARRLISDRRSGIALLKIDAETPFLTFAKARELTIAAPIIALGFPLALPLTPSFGIVGGFDVKYGDRYFATTHIRANLPVQLGEGGAPLLNPNGEVVGILISMLDSGSASFALPIAAAEKVRTDYLRFQEARPGWIGVHVKATETASSGSTARVEEVVPDGPAEKAGLRKGDVLLQLGHCKISAPEHVLDASFFLTAADEVELRIVRDGTELTLKIQPADPPNTQRAVVHSLESPQTLPRGLKVGE